MIVPRIKSIDQSWASQLMQYNEQGRLELLRELGERQEGGTQLEYAMLADHCHDLGLLHYAMGSSYEQVRQYLTEAALAYLRVFRLRGTQPAFSATLVELPPVSPNLPATDSSESAMETHAGEVLRRPLHSPGESDYSLTNSRTGLRAMYLALTVGQQDLARRIAELVFDPVDATYIGPNSEVCTPNEQRLAYALKSHLLANSIENLQLMLVEHPQQCLAQAVVIKALNAQNPHAFLSALNQLLSEHQRWAKSDSHRLEGFLCLPGIGLSASGLLEGLIELESLPAENVYLPRPLLAKPG